MSVRILTLADVSLSVPALHAFLLPASTHLLHKQQEQRAAFPLTIFSHGGNQKPISNTNISASLKKGKIRTILIWSSNLLTKELGQAVSHSRFRQTFRQRKKKKKERIPTKEQCARLRHSPPHLEVAPTWKRPVIQR